MILFFILFITTVSLGWTWIRFKYAYLFNIRVKTICMHLSGTGERNPSIAGDLIKRLVAYEAVSRRAAYKNTQILTDESFFDDSDMSSEYYLVVVYDKRSAVPLLTARYYFDHSVIESALNGDEHPLENRRNTIDLKKFKERELFLSDRLSGNMHSSVYRRHRGYIFSLFHLEILKYNKDCKFILMARKEKQEKLLAKYLRLGLNISGEAQLRGKPHWILLGDVSRIYAQTRSSVFLNGFLVLKFLIYLPRTK